MTNKKLVKHAEMALREKWGYVYGTFGGVLNETILNQKKKQYPGNIIRYESFIRRNWLGKRVADCVGLIKSYLWWNGGRVKYTPSQDKSADGMYNIAREKGSINTIPEIPGILVWKKGHIGIYVGGGYVIESHGTKYGVIKTPLKGNGSTKWQKWLKCPYISYEKEENVPSKEKLPANKVKLTLLGKEMIVDGYLKNGTNYVLIGDSYIPIRTLFESLGLKVTWNNGVVVDE